MAYNLDSLIQILEKDQHHLTLCCRTQIGSLLEQLRDIVKKLPLAFSYNTQHLNTRIRDAVHKTEDIVESHIMDQVISQSEGEACQLDLTSLMKEFDSISEEMSNMLMDSPPPGGEEPQPSPNKTVVGSDEDMDEVLNLNSTEDMQMDDPPPAAEEPEPGFDRDISEVLNLNRTEDMPMDDPPPAAEEPEPSPNTYLVGLDQDVGQLLDRLKSPEHENLQIIPIFGMGGIGKTILARKLYTHTEIAHDNHFDKRAWITISQQFDARHTLLSLLHCFGIPTHKMHKETVGKLGEFVYKILFGRRYFIVLDDIWETEAWDKLRIYFPNECHGSRIILTTRARKLANYVCKDDYAHEMRLLDKHNSWSLLVKNVFGQETCPPELVETGKKIANNCRGLPLEIIVMGWHLRKFEKTLEFWESVERDFKSASTEHKPQILEILSKSYNHLPFHLKPCFLYVAAFPEIDEIRASRIIKLWIAEGIIKPLDDKPLEDVAHSYLKDLIDRSLLSVCQLEPNGKVRTFKIHPLMRKLCQKKALEEKFLWWRSENHEMSEGEGIMRRVSVPPLYQAETVHLSWVRSYLCFSDASQRNTSVCTNSRLLRVLDVSQLDFGQFPTEIEKLINLRYLGFTCHSGLTPLHLPVSVLHLLNLQTLRIQFLPLSEEVCLPSKLWKMTTTQLMHIKFKGACIKYLPQNGQNVEHANLETLSNVEACGISELLCRAPRLRKLGIYYDTPINSAINLTCLQRLEKLKCSSVWPSSHEFLSFLNLPNSLKKLTVSRCEIPVEFMTKVGLLPHLEQLRLQQSDFFCREGEPLEPKWEPAEDGFPKLISLVMEDLNLAQWIVCDSSFPELQRLVIRGCYNMEGLDLVIGDRPTLEVIEVDECSPELLASVKAMEEDQQAFDNSLQFVYHPALLS